MLLLHALAWYIIAVSRGHGVESDGYLKEKMLTMEKEMNNMERELNEIRSVNNKLITAVAVSLNFSFVIFIAYIGAKNSLVNTY